MREPMTAADITYHLRWKASSGHPGGWRVTREDFRPGADRHLQELENKRRQPILFRTRAGAERRAKQMNETKDNRFPATPRIAAAIKKLDL